MKRVLLLMMLTAALVGRGQSSAHHFALGDSSFLLDGKPFQMISGEMHYTRVPREAWRQRMRMARAMGLNTIGTYVFWNVHEPEKGRFDFSGNNDIAAFVQAAREEGLWVVLRPSPYVCAEWEFGGYPYWLEKEQGLVVRSKEPKYLEEYRKYIHEVGRQLAGLQVNHGGNILMVQIENEYGSYGSDTEYLDINRRMFVEAGFDGLLYTCDPAGDVGKGHLPGLLPAVNGVDQPQRVKELVRANHDGRGPYYIAEWYPAWFDWWGTKHHRVPAERYAGRLDSVLGAGISINMYMFHGGTTRGFMNGANYNDHSPYEPQISSYDYDAPLDEAGNATKKYWAFRETIARHLPKGVVLPEVPAVKKAVNLGPVRLSEAESLFAVAGVGVRPGRGEDAGVRGDAGVQTDARVGGDAGVRPEAAVVRAERPITFEDLGQAYGYVLYHSSIEGGAGVLRIGGLRDFAIVFVNGKRVGVLDRRLKQDSLVLELPVGKPRLDILVENLGRINFGPYLLKNTKGIVGEVEWRGAPVRGWEMWRLPFDRVEGLRLNGAAGREAVRGRVANSGPAASSRVAGVGVANSRAAESGVEGSEEPMIRRGSFMLEVPADTYFDMRNWGKGCVWVNGHNLGRYWTIGPQQTVYVPAEWLKKGRNEVVVVELLKPEQDELVGIDHPVLDEVR